MRINRTEPATPKVDWAFANAARIDGSVINSALRIRRVKPKCCVTRQLSIAKAPVIHNSASTSNQVREPALGLTRSQRGQGNWGQGN
ncbi:MAG TPA: hypothetical protein VNU68_33030 [Verrucomicrobiae bacterium]|nr:hypothetical protein [Verrucomicrobiae bacterium]